MQMADEASVREGSDALPALHHDLQYGDIQFREYRGFFGPQDLPDL